MLTAFSTVQLGDVTLDLRQGRLIGPAGEVALRAKSFALLAVLARNGGRVMGKDALIAAVWPTTTVSDESLTQCIHDIRRALGPAGASLLRTVARRGYVLDLPITGPDRRVIPGSIAILPFVLTGPDAPRDQVLFDGLAHDVIGRLASLRSFHVIGRGTSFGLGHMADDPVGLGAMLNLAYVVSGRATVWQSRFRLRVDLTDCQSGALVWSDGFDLSATDVTHASRHLADPIVAAIAREVTLAERRRAHVPDENLTPDAWLLFHKGINLIFRSRLDLSLALDHFTQATVLDPGFARAHAFASFCHYSYALGAVGTQRNTAENAALATAEKAILADAASPVAHWAYGRAVWLKHDLGGSLHHVRHAIHLCPSFPQAYYMAGFIEAHQGDAAQAVADLNIAESLSPFDPFLASMQLARATAFARLGDEDAAADFAMRASGHFAQFDHLQCNAALILAGLGRVDQAKVIMQLPPATDPPYDPRRLFTTFFGMTDHMERLLRSGARALNLPL